MSNGKVAVITGAANANGQAIAARLAEDGYRQFFMQFRFRYNNN